MYSSVRLSESVEIFISYNVCAFIVHLLVPILQYMYNM